MSIASAIPANLRSTARLLNRGRWIRKARVARTGGGQVDLRTRLGFILLDAETDTYSYDLASPAALAEPVADVLGVNQETVSTYIQEMLTDAELRHTVRSRTVWRPQYKWQPPLGRHAIAYSTLRVLRPRQTVELGVRHGLGTLVMLRALERNARDGASGNLLSIDCDPTAAGLVRPHPYWRLVVGRTPEVLSSNLIRHPIGFAISDTTSDPAVTSREYDFVLNQRADRIALIQNGSWNDVLRLRAAGSGWRFREIEEQSRGHVVAGRLVHFASLKAPDDAN